MVACFRYASIDVHSVYLPPSKLDFNYENQGWINRELDEVVGRVELLFSEVLNAIRQLLEKRAGTGSLNSSMKTPIPKQRLVDLEGMLHKEKSEFEELVQKISNEEAKKCQPVVDILEINHQRRQLIFQSYMWDHRLIYSASLDFNSLQHDPSDFSPEKLIDMNIPVTPHKGSVYCESNLVDSKFNQSYDQDGEVGIHVREPTLDHQGIDTGLGSKHEKQNQANLSSGTNICGESDPLESN